MTKEAWRKCWLDSINELTSLDLQAKSWLDFNNTNPHWTFIEFRACYFDELFVAYDDYNCQHLVDEGLISKEEFQILSSWHESLNSYIPPNCDNCNHLAILNDPLWLEIVEEGRKAKNSLSNLLNFEEKGYLMREINHAANS